MLTTVLSSPWFSRSICAWISRLRGDHVGALETEVEEHAVTQEPDAPVFLFAVAVGGHAEHEPAPVMRQYHAVMPVLAPAGDW